ncbi:hypothetical protein B484DRAFT_341999, partial [Ochromonadaceae sp. CCMP2298]
MFDQTSPPPDRLSCGICSEVLRDPLQVCEDKHIFCRCCIDRWKDICIPTTCPMCRAPLSREEAATKEREEIQLLTVFCPSASCEWTGPLSDHEAHVAACPSVEVPCPFAEAGCAF